MLNGTFTRRALPFLRALLLLIVTALLTSLPAHAERWYRVELLIFRQAGGQLAEQWEATPNLAYPDAGRFLIDPADAADDSAAGIQDEFEPLRTAPSMPTPFVTLPHQALEFAGKAAYMQRHGGYRTLFHEAWIQAIVGRANTLPIILDHSGDTAQWPQLQGSITLYLARFLHLETDIWLNTDGAYLPSTWRMPPPPLGPPSVIVEEASATEPAFANEPAALDREDSSAEDATATSDEILSPSHYPFRHAVRLNQKRKMRSNEVHYIDHPMLGVVIKVTPLSNDELMPSDGADSQ